MPEQLTTMISDLFGSLQISGDKIALRLIAAIVLLGVGFLLSRRAAAAFRKALRRAKIDETLVTFFSSALAAQTNRLHPA